LFKRLHGVVYARGATEPTSHTESGRCDEAAEWQRKAIEAARQEGPPERVPPMEKELARYTAGAPCRPGE